MYKVSGKVIEKESGTGVPNLQVVLYDVNPTGAPNASNSASGQLTGFPPKANAPPGVLFWEKQPGNRLGSVVTGEEGRFELTFDSKAFASDDPGKRPDLILYLVAPEDSRVAKNGETFPFPDPTANRILHVSQDVVVNAGRSEEYIIRLSRELLARHSLSYKGPPGDQTGSFQLISAFDQTRQFEKLLLENESNLIKETVQRRRKSTEAARNFLKEFSATALPSRGNVLFAGDPKRADAPAKLKKASSEAQTLGLSRLKDYFVRTRPKVHIRLSNSEIAELLEKGTLRRSGSDYLVDSVCALLNRTTDGVTLERVRGLLQQAARPPEAPKGAGNGAPASGGNGASGNSTSPGAEDPEHMVRQRVLGQIQSLETPSLPNGSRGVMTNLLRMVEELKSTEQGPSDVAAIRDFHSLQIAFPHVWAEAFDGTLLEITENLYDETKRLHEDYGVEHPPLEGIREVNDLRRFLADVKGSRYLAVRPIPDAIAAFLPELDISSWSGLSAAQQLSLSFLAHGTGAFAKMPEAERRKKGLAMIASPQGALSRIERLTLELNERLAKPHAFRYFAPNSVNFGLMVTYRQEWTPEAYQVGDLVSSVPLAPNESRRYTTRQVFKTSRAQKELERSLATRQEESRQVRRAEDEILSRAQVATNFQMTAQGSLKFGIGEIGGSTQFALNQAEESSRVKRSFHEAVMKAAYEYKSERSLEVETSAQSELDMTSSGELSNPNNEVTVTYLMYELERRFRISEKLHRLTPVILVAQDIPAPHEIDEDWLLTHEWILRRVLLDDSFHSALDALRNDFARSEVSLGIKEANWKAQKTLVEKLEAQVDSFLRARDSLRTSLADLTQRSETASRGEPDDVQRGFLNMLTGGFSEIAGAFGGATQGEKLEAERKAAEMRMEYLKESLTDAQLKLTAAAEALNQATNQYARAVEEQAAMRIKITQCMTYAKENVLPCMQAIWAHEPPDQRLFRLYHVEVELPGVASETCRLRPATPAEAAGVIPGLRRDGRDYVIECGLPTSPPPERRAPKTLGEIADLDRPLGFKGNYIIFPLKECTHLTDFMMQEYVDEYFGLRDPDLAGNFTTEELLEYAERVRPTLTAAAEREVLDRMVAERLQNPRREFETLTVPTGQLFIEALVGEHSLMEPFKRLHRGLDVAKVEAEVRKANLENLRRAARLLGGDREDPEIDRKIVFSGDSTPVIVPPEA